MFGRCGHGDSCPFDLWAPSHRDKIENVEFSVYAKHTQETEDIIDTICEAYRNGITDFSIDLDDDFSDEEIQYIKEEVNRRLG